MESTSHRGRQIMDPVIDLTGFKLFLKASAYTVEAIRDDARLIRTALNKMQSWDEGAPPPGYFNITSATVLNYADSMRRENRDRIGTAWERYRDYTASWGITLPEWPAELPVSSAPPPLVYAEGMGAIAQVPRVPPPLRAPLARALLPVTAGDYRQREAHAAPFMGSPPEWPSEMVACVADIAINYRISVEWLTARYWSEVVLRENGEYAIGAPPRRTIGRNIQPIINWSGASLPSLLHGAGTPSAGVQSLPFLPHDRCGMKPVHAAQLRDLLRKTVGPYRSKW